MYEDEKPRRPVRVVILVMAFWVLGNIMQSVFGLVVAQTGLVAEGSVVWIGQILGWGLLFALSLLLRDPLDAWLRRS